MRQAYIGEYNLLLLVDLLVDLLVKVQYKDVQVGRVDLLASTMAEPIGIGWPIGRPIG